MKNKAQVGVVVLVLIILIVLVLILIVWNVIIPFISESEEDIEIGSFIMDLEVEEVVLFETGALRVKVNRRVGKGELDSLRFIFNGEGKNEFETIEENLPEELETKTYAFSPVLGIGKIDSVSVVPIVNNKLGRESNSEINKIIEIPGGLVSWWRFDDVNDFLFNNNGELIDEISLNNGRLISQGGYFNVLDDASLDINDKMAISFWIKTDSNSGDIIRKGNNYKVSLKGKKIEFSFSDGKIQTKNKINSNWTHVLISADVGGIKKIYINGGLELFQVNYNFNTNDEPLIIGEISGEFDEVMLFNEPLANSEALAIYNNQKENF
jgi:hypothetical protein